jgi:hypothetical protein
MKNLKRLLEEEENRYYGRSKMPKTSTPEAADSIDLNDEVILAENASLFDEGLIAELKKKFKRFNYNFSQ